MVVNVGVAMAAAMLLGTGFVLQQHAAEQAPAAYFLRLRLLRDLLHRRQWLAGVAVMVGGQLLSAWTVGHMRLSFAEPLLATSLIFALVLAIPLSRQPLQRSEMLGALMLSAGVAALSLARTVKGPSASIGPSATWLAAVAVAAVALLFVRAGWRRRNSLRATLTATGAGLVFGISDALTRRTIEIFNAHPLTTLLTTWPAYSLLVSTLAGLWLMENSFNAAPLHCSLPAITAAEPVAGITLGITVFGDVIHINPGMLALQAAGLAALVAGVILVARAPVLRNLRPPLPALHVHPPSIHVRPPSLHVRHRDQASLPPERDEREGECAANVGVNGTPVRAAGRLQNGWDATARDLRTSFARLMRRQLRLSPSRRRAG